MRKQVIICDIAGITALSSSNIDLLTIFPNSLYIVPWLTNNWQLESTLQNLFRIFYRGDLTNVLFFFQNLQLSNISRSLLTDKSINNAVKLLVKNIMETVYRLFFILLWTPNCKPFFI